MEINSNKTIFLHISHIASRLGCHQRPDRSLFIKGVQFPICARCTGVLIGQIIAIIFLVFGVKPNLILCIIGSAIMFADWFIQYKWSIESTNIRRVITGILCGLGMTGIYYLIIVAVIDFIKISFL